MANSFATIDMITNEALAVLHEKASFLKTINRQYDESHKGSGGAQGSTLRIRKPNRYTVTTGKAIDIQDHTETSVSLAVATQKHVAMAWDSQAIAQSANMKMFSENYLVPAMAQLVSDVENDVLQGVTKDVYNVVGTAGTPMTDLVEPTLARARLNQMLAPKDNNRSLQVDSVTAAGVVNGLSGNFHSANQLEKQYTEGLMGRTAGFDWYEQEKVWSMPNSADVAGTLDTYTVVEGDTDLTVTGFSAAPVEGMVFTIAGVYAAHPETKKSLGYLAQFVVTSATTTVINFSPAISLSGATQNVCDVNGDVVAPSTTAAIAFVGSASTSYTQQLAYHKDAFAFVTSDLPLMADASKCVVKTYDGLSLRCWEASDIVNDRRILRFDILYGYQSIRPEWACRITN